MPHAPLIDTTTWTTPRGVTRGARTYTDEQMAHWELHPDKPWLKNIAQDWDAFQAVATGRHDDKYATMSVDRFIVEQGYSEDFAEYNLRARINGMYYVNDRLPGSMPIRAVMSYYHLQEGIGSKRTTDAKRAQKAADAPLAASLLRQRRERLDSAAHGLSSGARRRVPARRVSDRVPRRHAWVAGALVGDPGGRARQLRPGDPVRSTPTPSVA
ncbi:MAG: hypothetical protein R3B99_06810 [Polyangiales bacterium]